MIIDPRDPHNWIVYIVAIAFIGLFVAILLVV